MSINTAPASRELTLFSRVINRDGERAQIRRAKVTFFANGGAVGVYAPGAAWDSPAAAYRPVRFGKVASVDVTIYLAPIKARREARRIAAAAQYEARKARSAEFDAAGWIDAHRFARAAV